jgi:hypothetical protein
VWHGEGDRGQLFCAESDPNNYPYIYRLNYGNEYTTGNGGAGLVGSQITMKLSTGLEDFNRPDLIKRFKSIRMNGKCGSVDVGPVDVDVVVDVDGAYTANVSDLDFSGGTVVRQASALPRYANGNRVGVQIIARHTLETSGPSPPVNTGADAFELYDLAWYYDTRQTRVRNVS